MEQAAAEARGLTEAGVAVVQVPVGSKPAVEPAVSVLPDTGGSGFAWMALAGVLLLVGGLLLKRIIR